MTERSRAELDEMRRRMVAAKDKPADILNFFYALESQPEDVAEYIWRMAERRLTGFENGEWHKIRGQSRPPVTRAAVRKHNRKFWQRSRY